MALHLYDDKELPGTELHQRKSFTLNLEGNVYADVVSFVGVAAETRLGIGIGEASNRDRRLY